VATLLIAFFVWSLLSKAQLSTQSSSQS
jgi:hypothetical protein